MTTIVPTPAPTPTPTSDAPSTLADAAPSLAEQLYTTAPVVPAEPPTPANPAPTPPPPADAAADGATDAAAATIEDGPEYVQDEQGRWHRPDGTMASAEELEAIGAQLAEAEQAKADEEANRPLTVAKIRDRAGNLIEVETGDEQLAQLINQNTNDGLRKREYLERLADVEARHAEVVEFQEMMRANPEAVILQHLPPEKQVSLAAQLLAQHFDALVPIIQDYDANPTMRLETVADAQRTIREQATSYANLVAAQTAAKDVAQAVAALIPADADDAQVDKFWKFAELELTAAATGARPVTPATVPDLLTDLCTHFGFTSAAPAAATSKPRITLAKPVQKSAPSTPAAGNAPAASARDVAQQRLRLTQQRRNAAAIPPQGRNGLAKPGPVATDRAFQDAANLLYGNTPRAS